eukprot:15460077-Alexandrium_andersonii.AAC.1
MEWGSPTFADSEPWRRQFGPLSVLETAALSGWISGPELTLIGGLSDRLGVPAYERFTTPQQHGVRACRHMAV